MGSFSLSLWERVGVRGPEVRNADFGMQHEDLIPHSAFNIPHHDLSHGVMRLMLSLEARNRYESNR